MDGGFELAQELPVMRGFKVVDLPEAFGQAKVLHNVATHRLILSRRARGAGAHGPTPSVSPRSCAGGCSALLTGPGPVWPGASPGDRQWRVSHPGHCETSVHETDRDRQTAGSPGRTSRSWPKGWEPRAGPPGGGRVARLRRPGGRPAVAGPFS